MELHYWGTCTSDTLQVVFACSPPYQIRLTLRLSRFVADLFGGRMLGTPTRLALPDLGNRQPHFYTWDALVERDRHAYIERIYGALNTAGEAMDAPRRARVVDEARLAFRHNAAVYTEDPRLVVGAVRGALRIAVGGVRAIASGGLRT